MIQEASYCADARPCLSFALLSWKSRSLVELQTKSLFGLISEVAQVTSCHHWPIGDIQLWHTAWTKGWNIEQMNESFPIEEFGKVILVDLTPSLCKVAEERFKRRGWNNVIVLCQDAAGFQAPFNVEGRVSLVTMSYSRKFSISIWRLKNTHSKPWHSSIHDGQLLSCGW